MGLKYQQAQVEVLLMQDKIITDKKNENIQQGIPPAAGGITKGLQRHNPAKWRIEKINKRYNPFFGHRSGTFKPQIYRKQAFLYR
jgi:hypothetical protein